MVHRLSSALECRFLHNFRNAYPHSLGKPYQQKNCYLIVASLKPAEVASVSASQQSKLFLAETFSLTYAPDCIPKGN